jgi:hypothetical protein
MMMFAKETLCPITYADFIVALQSGCLETAQWVLINMNKILPSNYVYPYMTSHDVHLTTQERFHRLQNETQPTIPEIVAKNKAISVTMFAWLASIGFHQPSKNFYIALLHHSRYDLLDWCKKYDGQLWEMKLDDQHVRQFMLNTDDIIPCLNWIWRNTNYPVLSHKVALKCQQSKFAFEWMMRQGYHPAPEVIHSLIKDEQVSEPYRQWLIKLLATYTTPKNGVCPSVNTDWIFSGEIRRDEVNSIPDYGRWAVDGL